MTHLIEILLPQFDKLGQPFEPSFFEAVKHELTHRFGGVTAFLRASAHGLWKTEDGRVVRDELAVFEVMTEEVDPTWWNDYRRQLEARFQQDEIVIRAIRIRRL